MAQETMSADAWGAVLNLPGPVSEAVHRRAMADPDYASDLLACKDTPVFRDFLLGEEPPAPSHGSLALIGGAAASTVKWAVSGFANVDDETYRRRLDTCAACKHQKIRPQQAVYALAGTEEKICGLCGCLLRTKARQAHARCPDTDPANPGHDRWGGAKA
jgi:hypothetical protein